MRSLSPPRAVADLQRVKGSRSFAAMFCADADAMPETSVVFMGIMG